MAKTSSAKKARRVNLRRKVFNAHHKKSMREAVKNTGKLITAKDSKGAHESVPALYKAIDKAAKHGTIKKNTAARMKARVAKRMKADEKK